MSAFVLAVALHSRVAVGGVQTAVASACPWQLAWQFTSALHIGGVIFPSHLGAVAVPMQPPLQLTMAPQSTFAFASSLQLPVHFPVHDPSQCPGFAAVYWHCASHWPLQ